MKRLQQSGLYEDLLTAALKAEINTREQEGWDIKIGDADVTVRSEILARHVYELVRRVLDDMSGDQGVRTAKQVALVNHLIDTLIGYGAESSDQVADTARLLLEAIDRKGLVSSSSLRPTRSLRQSGLLVNGRRDVQISSEINREIPSADRIDLLCAFVRYSGLRLFQDELQKRIDDGAKVRVIASVYTGSTERKALDRLVELGAEVKVSYDIQRTRLHAKAWLFHRDSGFHTAYIGSSNLTHTAQVDGLEWNVRISAVENPNVIERFKATFEQYWREPEFETYHPDHDSDRLDKALLRPNGDGESAPAFTVLIDVAPKAHQLTALEALESERQNGHNRNLVVAATGVGKTWIAAFDYQRLCDQGRRKSLLFVAHRDQILLKSQQVFQLVLRDPAFGERLVAGQRPKSGHYVFASIQSLNNRIDDIEPDDFEVVIIDEFHHAAAKSYDRLLKRLNPKILLGLTATPERADGQSVLHWFDHRIAYESRLWDALDQQLLCPFHYFGVNDAVDLSTVRFERGRYVQGDLDNVLSGHDVRAWQIKNAVEKYLPDAKKMRALGFCAGVNHAHFMAKQFQSFGYQTVALDGTTSTPTRTHACQRLRLGELHIIFTVDLFNEGVDLPEVDTVLMLRPTESATIFLQQLGRGLRIAANKRVLTVLDFVGQVREEYRYDIRYRALLGGTRHQVRHAIENDFPVLPPGCAIQLDSIAKETVLKNLKQAVTGARSRMLDDLKALGRDTRLKEFLEQANVELEELYAKPSSGHCFTNLRRQAGFADETGLPASGDPIFRTFGRLIHVDDIERLNFWSEILKSTNSHPISSLTGRNLRLGLMLFAIIGGQGRPISEADELVNMIRESTELRHEFLDLFDILADRIRTVSNPASTASEIPIASHATYTLGEIMAAYKSIDKSDAILLRREGVWWDETTLTDLLFITLEKSEKDFSPTTLYEDYPISQDRFHWMSQNSASPNTKNGRRYIRQSEDKTNVLLFVRERKKDSRGETQPYHCLGCACYEGHESEKPMKITWKLDRAMPGWMYQAGKVVAG